MKRLMWFGLGAAAGVSGSAYARRKAREAAERYRPVSMAKGMAGRVADAVREGRAAAAAKEAELRARQDGTPVAEPMRLMAVDEPAAERRRRSHR